MAASNRQNTWGIVLQIGMVAGLATAAIAWTWALLEDPAKSWTHTQAAELSDARDQLHQSRSALRVDPTLAANPGSNAAQPRIDAAKRRVDDLEKQLEYARTGRSSWLRRIAAAGLGLTVLCGLGYLAFGRDRPRRSS
jgi:hypothetical protein